MAKNIKNSSKKITPRLCGGTFCDLLMQIKNKTIPIMIKGLVYVLDPTYNVSEGSISTNATEYIQCSQNNFEYLPFNRNQCVTNQNIVDQFEDAIKTSNNDLYKRFVNYIDKNTNSVSIEWLIKALLELIELDTSINDDDEFYIDYSEIHTTKKQLIKRRNFNQYSFLLGVFFFTLDKRPNNDVGRDTYDKLWHKKQEKVGARRDFISDIGRKKIKLILENKKEHKNASNDNSNSSNSQNILNNYGFMIGKVENFNTYEK